MLKYVYCLLGFVFLGNILNAKSIPNIAHTIWLGGTPSSLGPAQEILNNLPDGKKDFELNIWIYNDTSKAPITTDNMEKFIDEMKDDNSLECEDAKDTIFITCSLEDDNQEIKINFRNIEDVLPKDKNDWSWEWVNFYTGLKTSFSNHYAGAADLLRFLILKKYGGHYMDYKSQPKNLYKVEAPEDGILIAKNLVNLLFPTPGSVAPQFGLEFINIDTISSLPENDIINKVLDELKESYQKIENSHAIKFALEDSLLTGTRRYYTIMLNVVPLIKVLFRKYTNFTPTDEDFERFAIIDDTQKQKLLKFYGYYRILGEQIKDKIASTELYYDKPDVSLSWDRFFYLNLSFSSVAAISEKNIINLEVAKEATLKLIQEIKEKFTSEESKNFNIYTEKIFSRLFNEYHILNFNDYKTADIRSQFTKLESIFINEFQYFQQPNNTIIKCCSSIVPIIRVEIFKMLSEIENKESLQKEGIKGIINNQKEEYEKIKKIIENDLENKRLKGFLPTMTVNINMDVLSEEEDDYSNFYIKLMR